MTEGNTKDAGCKVDKRYTGRTFKVYVLDFNLNENMLGSFLTSISKLGPDMQIVDIQNVVGLGLRVIVSYGA